MISLLADEDLHHAIVVGVRRRRTDVDFRDVREVGLASGSDVDVLRFAAEIGSIVVTHDSNTMTRFARERVQRGESMPGLVVVPQDAAIGAVVSDLVLIATVLYQGEWEGQVHYIPF